MNFIYSVLYFLFYFYQGKRNKKRRKRKLSNPLPKYPRGICKLSDINCGGTNIHILKESTFVALNVATQSAYSTPSLKVWLNDTSQRREESCLMQKSKFEWGWKSLWTNIRNKIQTCLRIRFNDDILISKVPS